MKMIRKPAFFLPISLLLVTIAGAQIEIPTVIIGDPGNPADTRVMTNDGTSGYGSVAYVYHIGKYEVTNGQYAAFLNAVASSDPHALYDLAMAGTFGGITRSGEDGSFTYTATRPNAPVNYVSFWSAARFANWLTNGQGSGGTETGVYDLTDPVAITNNTVTRDATAWANGGVAIASENEWYKAAYYSGSPTGAGGEGYWLYPTQSNSITTSDANYNYLVGDVTDVGTYTDDPSYYGTFDQAGNVSEWNDELLFSGSSRGVRGGSFFNRGTDVLQAAFRNGFSPAFLMYDIGFRVTSLNPIVPTVPPDITASLEMSTDGENWSAIEPGVQTVVGPVAFFRVEVSPLDAGGSSVTLPVTVNFPEAGGTVDVQLMTSTDLMDWTPASPGEYASGDGKFFLVETDTPF